MKGIDHRILRGTLVNGGKHIVRTASIQMLPVAPYSNRAPRFYIVNTYILRPSTKFFNNIWDFKPLVKYLPCINCP